MSGKQDLTTAITKAMLETLSRLGKLTAKTFYKQTRKRLSETQLQALRETGGDDELKRIRYYLKRKNYIETLGRGFGASINITEQGQKKLTKLDSSNLTLDKNQTWDGKWRVLTFDIPESNRSARDALRRWMQKVGFRQLHRSVWIHPLPVRKQINQIKHRYGLENHVTLLEVSDFDRSDQFRQVFENVIQG